MVVDVVVREGDSVSRVSLHAGNVTANSRDFRTSPSLGTSEIWTFQEFAFAVASLLPMRPRQRMRALSRRVSARCTARPCCRHSLDQDGLMAAGRLADGEVGIAIAQEALDLLALVGGDVCVAAVGNGDRLLGEIEAKARWVQAMAECGRDLDDVGCGPIARTVACRNCIGKITHLR